MIAKSKDLVIRQNTTFSKGWQVTYNGAPIDATWSAQAVIRLNPESSTVLATLLTTVNSDGSVVIAATPEITSAWNWDSGYYGVVVTSPGGVRLSVREGRIFLARSIVR